MPAIQSPGKIYKFWLKTNKRWGAGQANDVKKKLKDKTLSPKDKQALKQNERITRGLMILRNVARGGLAGNPSKMKRFEKNRTKILRVMKKYCKLVKTTKLTTHEDLIKFRKSLKRFAVVVETINPMALTANVAADDQELDVTAFDDVDTSSLDKAMEDPSFGDYPDEEFDDEDDTKDEASAPHPSEEDTQPQTEQPEPVSSGRILVSQRLVKLSGDYKRAVALNGPDAPKMQQLFQLIRKLLGSHAYDKANQALDNLESLVKTAFTNSPTETPPKKALPGSDQWIAARAQATRQLRKLQTAIARTKDPEAKSLVAELEKVVQGLPRKVENKYELLMATRFVGKDPDLLALEGFQVGSFQLKFRTGLTQALQQMARQVH
ncbi:MAG: hypothetical protein ACFCD0_29145 [Gemmataceae bacterium]